MIIGLDMLIRAAYCRSVLRALQIAFSKRSNVDLVTLERSSPNTYRNLEGVKGIIGFFDEADRPFLENPPVPVVNISSRMFACPAPMVTDDNTAIGRCAAQHLTRQGCERFAFCGRREHQYSVAREEGFRTYLASLPTPPEPLYRYFDLPESALHDDHPDLAEWLRSLRRPTGLFAVNDETALRVSRIAKAKGVGIPSPLAVLGADDDDLSVLATGALLSSIRQDFEGIAERAAELILGLVRGAEPPAEAIAIPPLRVIARASTDTGVVRDPLVRRALAFIECHHARWPGTGALAESLRVSRRHLEYRFRAATGATIFGERRRLQLEEAKRLLRETTLRVHEVGEAVGLPDGNRFTRYFRQAFRITPSAYRRLHLHKKTPTRP